MALAQHVLATIRRHALVPRGGRVVVALSGGPDSVALLDVLRTLEQTGDLAVVAAAHFNHHLRGDASDQDEAFCRELARRLGVPLEVGHGDVRAAARDQKRSIEDAARRLRYAFLESAADRLAADAVAVGHSRDDQAETFLLRLIRGSGTRGLGAIRPTAGRIVRPLIDTGRAELRQYAAERGLSFRDDESNADVTVPRNRVRHELLPYLQREFSPGIVRVLAREAALARDDEDRLEKEAIDLGASIVLVDTAGQRVSVDTAALAGAHPALKSRVARHALGHFGREAFIGFEHVERFLDFIGQGHRGDLLSLPAQQAVHTGAAVELRPSPVRSRPRTPIAPAIRVPLAVPGEATAGDWCLTSQRPSDTALHTSTMEPHLTVSVRGIEGGLAVRFRRPGDRFEPPGLGGRTKKLQDYFVDRKVARMERDRLPLVVDAADRIVWVVGHGVSEGFRALEPSSGVILLKARRLGGEV